MLVARSTARPLQRGLASGFTPPSSARHLHMRVPPLRPQSNIVTKARILISSALNRLAGVMRPVGSLPTRTYSMLAPRTSIAQSLSMPARFTLAHARGGTPFMPRPIAVQRSMQTVGLGTARTFATSRPVFANLVENVPVAARALLEADFDYKSNRKEQFQLKKALRKPKTYKKAKAPKRAPASAVVAKEEVEKLDLNALSQYFKVAPEASIVTYLDIPLAPTPSGRMPLAEHPLPGPALAPLHQLHAAHSKHAIKVASLFRRLDAAHVWEHGAAMEAFGDRTGLCTVLRVKFAGWTKARVLSVIGEGGKGWCALIETSGWARDLETDTDVDSILSSDPASPWLCDDRDLPLVQDITASFIMPTLEFSEDLAPSRTLDSDHYSASDEDDFLSEPESLASVWGTESVHSANARSAESFTSEHWRCVSSVITDF